VAEIRSFVKTPEIQREQPPSIKKTGYRVDTVPWPLRPLYLAVAWAAGVVLYLYYFFCRMTSLVSIEDQEITTYPDIPSFAFGTRAGGRISLSSGASVPLTP
jgi:hypothetical protein